MLKASNDSQIFLGLSEKNLELLKEGKPIVFNLKQTGLADSDKDIIIFYGKTEQEMAKCFDVDVNIPNMRSLPSENIDKVIDMLNEHSYGEEQYEECLNDLKKVDDSFAFNHAVMIKLLGGKLDGEDN